MQPSYGSTEDVWESIGLSVKILKIGGLWYKRDKSHRETILQNVQKTLVLLVYYTVTFSIYVYLFVAWGSFNDMIETIAYSISLTILGLKYNIMIFRADEVQHIVKTVRENFFIHRTELSIENRKLIQNIKKLARKVTVAYATMQASTVAVFMFGPLTSYTVILETHNASNISSETPVYDRNLPFQLWIPLDATRSPQYEISYLCLVLWIFMSTWNTVGIEVFCMTSFIYLTGQFELLCDSLRNASGRVKYRLDQRNHSSAGSDGINKHLQTASVFPANGENVRPAEFGLTKAEYEEDMVTVTKQLGSQQNGTVNGLKINYGSPVKTYSLNIPCSSLNHRVEMERYLEECIGHHQRLIGFSEKLNALLETVYFVQFLTASVLICFIGVIAISMPINGDFAKLIGYLASVNLQLGLYCILGSNLIVQSEEVFNAAYDSDWYNQSQHYRYCIGMMIMRGQSAVKVTAGRFGTLSLPLFASMLRTAYSYVAVLRQMNEE